MKLGSLSLAVLVALAIPGSARADTVYYSEPGANRIQTISGKIVQESDGHLKIATEDGDTVSIPKSRVFQVVREEPSTSGRTDEIETFGADGTSDDDFAAVREALSGRKRASRSRTYHLGIKGGMNISNMSVDPQELEDGDSLQSFAVGAWWGMPLNRRLTIQAEALYSVKGDAENADGYTVSTEMGYLDVPVLAKIGFLHDAPAKPSLYLGPSLAVNLSAKAKLEGDGGGVDVDVKEQIRTFDLGLVVGGGLDFAVAGRTFGVDVRYSKGLSDIAGENANGSARNDVLAVMGSVRLQ